MKKNNTKPHQKQKKMTTFATISLKYEIFNYLQDNSTFIQRKNHLIKILF